MRAKSTRLLLQRRKKTRSLPSSRSVGWPIFSWRSTLGSPPWITSWFSTIVVVAVAAIVAGLSTTPPLPRTSPRIVGTVSLLLLLLLQYILFSRKRGRPRNFLFQHGRIATAHFQIRSLTLISNMPPSPTIPTRQIPLQSPKPFQFPTQVMSRFVALQTHGVRMVRRQFQSPSGHAAGPRTIARHVSRHAAVETHRLERTGAHLAAVGGLRTQGTGFALAGIGTIGRHVSNLAAAVAFGRNVLRPVACGVDLLRCFG